jgi:hypothetical protein
VVGVVEVIVQHFRQQQAALVVVALLHKQVQQVTLQAHLLHKVLQVELVPQAVLLTQALVVAVLVLLVVMEHSIQDLQVQVVSVHLQQYQVGQQLLLEFYLAVTITLQAVAEAVQVVLQHRLQVVLAVAVLVEQIANLLATA